MDVSKIIAINTMVVLITALRENTMPTSITIPRSLTKIMLNNLDKNVPTAIPIINTLDSKIKLEK